MKEKQEEHRTLQPLYEEIGNETKKEEMMFTKKSVFILLSIVIFTSMSLFAQYSVVWTSLPGVNGGLIACEDTDGDGFKEFLFDTGDEIKIVDVLTGTIEWESGTILGININMLIDYNSDGIVEIYYVANSERGLIMYSGSISSDPNAVGRYKQILHQNFPNPFNPETTIKYSLKNSGFVELKIYNIKGQLVQTLVRDEQSVGNHSIIWNAKGISSGQYFYQISIDGKAVQTKKAIVLK